MGQTKGKTIHMVNSKKDTPKATPSKVESINKGERKAKVLQGIRSIIGVILYGILVSAYIQMVPMMVVFTGSFLGIPSTGDVPDADMMLWGTMNAALVLFSLVGVVTLLKMIWHGLIKRQK